jgi:transcriptional repressor NrdR
VKCPFCSHAQDKVVDSRESTDGRSIRRRRECLKCSRRFTTYEEVQEILPLVIKKDGRREAFKREKILKGLQTACQKRPIPTAALEGIVDEIERKLVEKGDKETDSHEIGEMVVGRLKALDEVAYIRFASVYKDFKDREAFVSELSQYLKK